MNDKQGIFERFTNVMDKNIRGVQYGVYAVGLVGLGIALRSMRPFKKFSKPQDIPKHFVEKHMTFHGRVQQIEPGVGTNPPLLMIEHYPLVSLNRIRPRSPNLPVQISSIDVTSNGISWLQHIVVGSEVKFTVLKVNPASVCCIVLKKDKNIAQQLVSLGFASVSALDFALEKNKLYLKYYKYLLAAESKAERKGLGMWMYEPSFLERLLHKMLRKFKIMVINIIPTTRLIRS